MNVRWRPLRVFVEPSGYAWHNLGDTAMFEAVIARLRSRWPAAHVRVHCLNAAALAAADPACEPIDPYGSVGWSADIARGHPLRLAQQLRRHVPFVMVRLAEAALTLKRRDPRAARRYLDVVRSSDLVLVSGAGSVNDSFKEHAGVVLETLELGIGAGAVTALVGQGLGPMEDHSLRRHAASVLSRVDFISLREGVAGLPLLRQLGVREDRVVVTGDDAIACAYRGRPTTLGSALGVNLRVAPYAEIDDDLARAIGTVVRDAARRFSATPLPIPISSAAGSDDLQTARRMLDDPSLQVQAGTTVELLPLVARCRVVVAGSYHAAVFALSMGIPAVAVAKSDYYIHKFRGLAGQFGRACRVVIASGPDVLSRVRLAIDDAWHSAKDSRAELLESAARQVALSESAYARLFQLVESRRPAGRR